MNSQENRSRVSRRAFMSAAGLGIAGTALGTVTVANAQEASWTHETDVIVVGSGGAGLAGAIGAVDNGASVIVLEKAPVIGGTTAKSGGGYWIPNSHHMRAAGISDDRDTFLRYCARVSFPELYKANHPTYGLFEHNFRLLETFYDNAARIVEHMDNTGALPSYMETSWEGAPAPDYHGQIPENGGIRGRQTHTHNADMGRGAGGDMIRWMSAYVRANGGDIREEHRVVKIVRDGDGRVVGVHADTPNGIESFRARKGVIFGSGGFTHNPEMRANFQRTPIMGGCAVPSNTGDLVLMSAEIGVKLGNMNEAWNQQVVLDEVLQFSSVPGGVFFLGGDSMIMVNRFGHRTANEKSVYPERTRSHQVYDAFMGNYPNLYQIMIFDEKAREFGGQLIPGPDANIPGHVIVGETLEDLARGIDAKFASFAEQIGDYAVDENFVANLRETIARYNRFAETGKDLDFHRGEPPIERHFHPIPLDRGLPQPYLAPISDTGPYYAVLLGAGALDTKGGPAFDVNGQVLDVHDQPIPGLYAAGNCTASPSGKSYLGGGGTLGLGVTFGYLAGEHAAAQA